MRLFSSKRRVAAAAVLLLLALFLWRPGASRLKSRIIYSISASVGRPVDIGSVEVRLLPRPGFDLSNLVVYDDPALSAEPILRANEVTASLRLTSLLRGHIEIARLDMTEPSLNLVHSPTGRWNLESLLERSSQIPLAPTGKAKTEPRPGFPYIEASSGRINFKNGAEKTPYALTNADFSLWQDSDNSWGVRLKAQPVRTNLNLSDTGILRVNGTWQRAPAFRDTPLDFSVEWSRAQLGQVSKLLTDSDKGWRGEITFDVSVKGTPAQLKINGTGSLEDFRRYDITAGEPLRLAANCVGEYSSLTHEFHEMLCSAPVGAGLITLTGDIGLPGSHRYSIVARAENVPAAAAFALAGRAKKNLPPDLQADGTIGGNFVFDEDASVPAKNHFEGRGEVADLRLTSVVNNTSFGPETIPFSVGDAASELERSAAGLRTRQPQLAAGLRVDVGPFSLGAGPAAVRGWFNRAQYNLRIIGETEVGKSLRLARLAGIPALSTNAEGPAVLDLQINGNWSELNSGTASGFQGPQVTGTARLHNVQAFTRPGGSVVQVASADMQLSPDHVRVTKLNAKAAAANWTGTIDLPRGCGVSCPVTFNLHSNQITYHELVDWVSPSPAKRPWYRVLGKAGPNGPSLFSVLHASGQMAVDQMQIHGLIAKRISAQVKLESGALQLSDVNAELLGGKYRGDWKVAFGVKPVVCRGSGNFSALQLAGLSSVMDDTALSGSASASFEVNGKCPADFWQSADGNIHFDFSNGSLPRLSLTEPSGPLHVLRLTGTADLHDGKLAIKNAALDSASGRYSVEGNASLKRDLDLKLVRNTSSGGYAITGTLAEPQVTSLSGEEQAHLKTPSSK